MLAGSETLSGDNSYQGTTTINGGTLLAGGVNCFSSFSPVTLTPGANLDLGGLNQEIASLSGTAGTVKLGAGTLTLSNGSGTFGGIITGNGGLTLLAGSETLSGDNTYAGTTTITGGTLILTGSVSGLTNNIVDNGSLIFAQSTTTTYSNTITGTGSMTVAGTGNIILTNPNNTYTGGTTISSGTLLAGATNAFSPSSDVVLANALGAVLDLGEFNQSILSLSGGGTSGGHVILGAGTLTTGGTLSTLFGGSITGSGSVVLQGSGTMTLTNAGNIYTGGTLITNSSRLALQGAGSLLSTGAVTLTDAGIFDLSAITTATQIGPLSGTTTATTVALGSKSLTINESSSTTYPGTFTGTASALLTISGGGLLNLTGNSSTFAGLTLVNGKVAVNGNLGNGAASPTIVTSGGTLSGNGYLGQLTVNAGGTLSPGNSIGIINVITYSNNGGNYLVEINAQGQCDLINASGAVTLNGGTVVISVDGVVYDLNHRYVIVTGASVTGTYAGLTTNLAGLPSLITAALSYDPQHVYFSVQTAIVNAANTCNQRIVAAELDAIGMPDSQQITFLNQIINLSFFEVQTALNSLTGEQHTDDLLTTGLINRQFVRRMYDPLRSIVTASTDVARCWGLFYNVGESKDMTLWAEAGGGQTYFNGRKDGYGLDVGGYEITMGLHKTFCRDWTIGIAGSREYDHMRYSSDATGESRTEFLGLYGLYRPRLWYGLVDFAYGNSSNTLNRTIDLSTTRYKIRSSPHINQYTFYGELGCDFRSKNTLVQPFAGIEVGAYTREKVTEDSQSGLQLYIKSRKFTNVFTRTGLRVTTYRLPYNTYGSIDLSWLKQLSNKNNVMHAGFVDFGNTFSIQGANLHTNSFEGSLTLSSKILRDLRLYTQASGAVGFHFYTYNLQGGLEFLW